MEWSPGACHNVEELCEPDGRGKDNEQRLMDNRVVGCYIAWRLRHQSKTEWLASNKTQKG